MTEDDTQQKALKTLAENKVAIFVVAYNAERHIEDVLARIPNWVAEKLAEIFIIDDRSSDNTAHVARQIDWPATHCPLKVFTTPYNLGYGGNQKLGYRYALQQNFDIVVLLHGDGQYAPESLPQILAPYAAGASVVYGSRFLEPGRALKGGMPLYKWVGNRILTFVQNKLLRARLSEMHSGYRSYRMALLETLPFAYNSSGFDFDADIIVQVLASKHAIVEVPIPTYYGDELCRVNGLGYAWNCVKTCLKFRMMEFELFYDPKFDLIDRSKDLYTTKFAETSVHYHVRSLPLSPNSTLLDVGGGSGDAVSSSFAERGVQTTCIDQHVAQRRPNIQQHSVNLNQPWDKQFPIERYDTVFALDVLEHLSPPEAAIEQIFDCLRAGGKLYASTANVAFLPVRLMLLLGFFNYGRKGILDLTHTRLFTIGSFRRYLKNAGFRIDAMRYFGPPIADLANDSPLFRSLDKLCYTLANLWPAAFAYQILAECTRVDSLEDLSERTFGVFK